MDGGGCVRACLGLGLGVCVCVRACVHGRVEIIANDQGNRTTPSYAAFTDTERLVGDAAKNQATMNPENSIYDAKRLIGRKYDDPLGEIDSIRGISTAADKKKNTLNALNSGVTLFESPHSCIVNHTTLSILFQVVIH